MKYLTGMKKRLAVLNKRGFGNTLKAITMWKIKVVFSKSKFI
jgi:hypothetical protein